jgi:acyl dehydratase
MSGFDPSDFEILYPGALSERERTHAQQYLEANRALEAQKDSHLATLSSGTFPPSIPGLLASVHVTEAMVRYNNSKYDPENRLLHDADYARTLGYRDIIAMPCFAAHDDTFMVAYRPEARDTLLASQLNHSVNNYRPIYPGDTLFMIANRRTVTDLTPMAGSIYRSLVLRTEGSAYNQRGEKINGCL